MYILRFSLFTLLVIASGLMACRPGARNKAGVELAMYRYDHLILELKADSIALLYTTDGDLGNVAHGRDSIRRFLSGFKNVRVLSQVSHTNSLQVYGDSALQTGRYRQEVIVDGRDTVHVKGIYTARWVWINGDGWHIRRMDTRPG